MEKDEGNAMMEELDATNNLNVVEINEPVQSKTVAREQEEAISETPFTDEIDLVERVQEEVINKTPTTDEIDLIEREQEEVINKTPTTDEIYLVERVQEEAINETSAFVEKDLVEREDEDTINETVSYSFTTDNELNSLGTSIEEKSFIQEKLTEDTVTSSMEKDESNVMMEREDEDTINETVSYSFTTDNGLNSLGTSIEEKSFIQGKLTEDTVTSSMEKDEGDATMEELDATKNLNLVDVNEPVQSDVVESEQEEVTNENGPSSSTTDNGLNRIEEKVIQETLTDGAVTSSMEKYKGHDTMEAAVDATKKLNLDEENEPVQADVVKREQEEVTNENVPSISTTDNGLNRIEEKVIQETLTGDTEILETSSDCWEIPSAPGQPIEIYSSSNSVDLDWKQPEKGLQCIDSYEIKHKQCNTRNAKWIAIMTEASKTNITVPNLRCGTEYEIKVRAVNEDGEEGPFSPSLKICTKTSLAKLIQPTTKQIKIGNPSVFKLPLTESSATINYRARTRKCIFGDCGAGCQEKTIMLVGATGSGKSTLIDGIINYITDVSWDDDFRFSLVDLTDDEKNKKANKSESQTEWITCYSIHKMDGSKIDYDLNIIDTPGFGDTRGIIRDKAIVDQIREFFTTPGDQGIAFLDAVCFVTQAPLCRLTPSQKYIFDAILAVFGQDIASNIYVLITFADGSDPPVRGALRAANVPFEDSYKFNNSALFASSENSDQASFGNLFWKMGQESFRIFLKDLKQVESRSLQLTAEVLQIRKCLEATIQGLQPQIAEGMNQLNTIRQEKEILQKHKTDIACNRNFHYEVEDIHMRKIDLQPEEYTTNCLTCNRTCHYPCAIPDDKAKRGCAVMQCGSCTVCPKKCDWSMHVNNSFRFETFPVTVTKTYAELKQKYDIAQVEEKKQISVIGKVKNAFSSLGSKVMKMVSNIREYINKLNAIALRPNPLSDLDYIDLLIVCEKNERKYGWKERCKLFDKMRKEAELMKEAIDENYSPWDVDKDILD